MIQTAITWSLDVRRLCFSNGFKAVSVFIQENRLHLVFGVFFLLFLFLGCWFFWGFFSSKITKVYL